MRAGDSGAESGSSSLHSHFLRDSLCTIDFKHHLDPVTSDVVPQLAPSSEFQTHGTLASVIQPPTPDATQPSLSCPQQSLSGSSLCAVVL